MIIWRTDWVTQKVFSPDVPQKRKIYPLLHTFHSVESPLYARDLFDFCNTQSGGPTHIIDKSDKLKHKILI